MAKTRDVTFRPMYGFTDTADVSKRVHSISAKAPISEDEAKDKLIAQLRASLAALEAKEEKRRIAAREGMRKKRAK